MRVQIQILAAAALSLLVTSVVPIAHSGEKRQKGKYQVTWLLGHRNLDFFEEAAEEFKHSVEKRSNGEIEVSIKNSPDTGADASLLEAAIPGRVASGEIEMGHSFVDVLGQVDKRYHVYEAPFLFRGYRHMEGVIEGPIGTGMLEDLKKQDLVGMSFTYSGGANGVATKDRPIRRPEDLKGLRVGVTGNEVDHAWLKQLGAIPVPLGHGLDQIAGLAGKGELDGVVITWRNFAVANLQHTFKYMSLMDSTYLVSVTYANDKWFASLPKEYQTMLMEESLKAAQIERARTIQLNADSKQSLLSKGVRPAPMTRKATDSFKKAVQPSYDGVIGEALGKDFIEGVKAAPDGKIAPTVPGVLARN